MLIIDNIFQMLFSTFVFLVLVAGLESHPVGSQGPCNQVQTLMQALSSSSIARMCQDDSGEGVPNTGWLNMLMAICDDDVSCYDEQMMYKYVVLYPILIVHNVLFGFLSGLARARLVGYAGNIVLICFN